MKTLWNILRTIGVIVISGIAFVFLGVLCFYCEIRDIYREVKNPKPEGYATL
jgi:hypothetical protein